MTLLILGLIVFLGVHSVRIFADGWRTRMREKLGENAWKGLYSVLSIAGFVAIVYGYGQARLDATMLWLPRSGHGTWRRCSRFPPSFC